MKLCNPGQETQIVEAIASASTLLTDAQKAALTEELAKPVYAQMTTAQVLTALYGERSVVVPAGTRERLATWPETVVWLRTYQSQLLLDREDLSPAIRQKWLTLLPNILTQYPNDYTYLASVASTFAAISAQAVADGILPQSAVDAFRAGFIAANVEEHAEIQPPIITTLVDGGGNRLFPDGVALEPSDIEECRS